MKLFSLFRRQRPAKFQSSRDAMTQVDYVSAFAKAVRFTRHNGFAAGDLLADASDCLDSKGQFFNAIVAASGIQNGEGMAGQCLKWCHFLQPAAEKVLNRRVWLTIGQLWKGDRWLFSPSFEDLESWIKQGLSLDDCESKEGLNLHAWLTVDTGEIIEPTFLTTLASVHPEDYGDMAGTAVWGRDPNVLVGHHYVPMLIGQEAAEALSRMSPAPLLARNYDELKRRPAAIMIAG
jgi:hypothetical protein